MRFIHSVNRRTRAWRQYEADYVLPNGERFGIVMPLHRLLRLLRGA